MSVLGLIASHVLQDAIIFKGLERAGLIAVGEQPLLIPLPGGVSSDIYRVDIGGRSLCVKRALHKLRVAADWYAPIERNALEVAWMRAVHAIAPSAVPEIVMHDRVAGLFVMEYLEPTQYPNWKAQLSTGTVDAEFARAVGDTLARIHSATAGNSVLEAMFDSAKIFDAIRVEPYLRATGRVHAELRGVMETLAERTLGKRIALVHGDVSPKNLLVGAHGPVFLDAECAWYGDPAFDLAFCLNHLLLKCVWHPKWADAYLVCFDALASSYLQAVDWEPRGQLEDRVARLLPALMLARVDGKSPVEYIAEQTDRERVRRFARQWLVNHANDLEMIRVAWAEALTQ